MQVNEIETKSIITKSQLPSADFVINPFVGCMHSCVYCYAKFMRRFTDHSEAWCKFIDVKINAPELIPANTTIYKGKSILLSSVTDPYIPIEKKYELTRKIIQKLIPLNPNLCILTKSSLLTRDIDLFKQFKDHEIGLTITTLDDDLRKQVEPFSSSIEERIEALKELKKARIKTYVFIGPILPHLTDWKEIVRQTKKYTDKYMFENLNIRGVWGEVRDWLAKSHPDLLQDYYNIYRRTSDYWSKVEKDIEKFCKDIPHETYFHHGLEIKQ